jgi:acyl-CoA synthetase (AMP-forming)/AMP-acid ligase II
MTLQSRLHDVLTRSADSPAVEYDGVWHTWRDLNQAACALEASLRACNVPLTASIAWVARNRPDHLGLLFGLLAAGRSLIVVSSVQSQERIALEIERLAPDVVIADATDWKSGTLTAACTRVQALGLAVSGKRVVDRPETFARRGSSRAQTLTVLTSGTTGAPKRIPLSMSALVAAADDMQLIESDGDVPGLSRSPFPMFWPLANISGLYYTMPTGLGARPLVLIDKFSVAAWVEAVERHRPRLLWLPPAAIRMVLDADVPKASLASAIALRYGASPLDAHMRESFETRYDIPILSQYGATEFAGIVACWTLADHHKWGDSKRGSVGRARPGMRLRIVDGTTGAELPVGAPGQLQIHVPRIGEGWQTTNDIAHMDADGFVYLEGRADDAINRGGFKVIPDDVAGVLRQHPAVRDVAVVGMPHERLGQVPVAVVEALKANQPPTDSDLDLFARARLLAYQIPIRYLVVSEIPRTPTLKVDRGRLRKLLENSQ